MVNIFDLTFLGGHYNTICGDPIYHPQADINDDCIINIADVNITGGNYLLSSPVSWP